MGREFNNAAGFTRADDCCPALTEAAKTGPAKGKVSMLPEMLPIYHEARVVGTPKVGRPLATRDVLAFLGQCSFMDTTWARGPAA
jgi:hypothetical protein